jgi:hypothetical protein
VTRLCLVGNSHIASPLAAVRDGLFAGEGLSVAFWGCPGRRFGSLRFLDGRLEFADPEAGDFAARAFGEGRATLPLAGFDAVAFCGGAVRPFALVTGLHDHLAQPGTHLSEDYLVAGTGAWLEGSVPFSVACEVAASGFRVFLVGEPFAPEAQAPAAAWPDEDMASLRFWLEATLTRRAAASGIEYVPQPEETLARGFCTRDAFAARAVRLGAGEPGELRTAPDGFAAHMNAEFGALVLAALADRLRPS